MHALREAYDFITGGSVAAPAGLACAIIATTLAHVYRGEILGVILVVTFVASTLEKPT